MNWKLLLMNLQVNRAHYEGHAAIGEFLGRNQGLFRIIEEFTRIIEEGYITTDD